MNFVNIGDCEKKNFSNLLTNSQFIYIIYNIGRRVGGTVIFMSNLKGEIYYGKHCKDL